MRRSFDSRVTRRALLGAGATTLAATAGCSGLPPLGSRVNFGKIDAPGPGKPVYRRWLPAPTAAGSNTTFGHVEDSQDRPGYMFNYSEPPAFEGAPPPLNYARDWNAHMLDYFGVGFDNYERLVSVDFAAAVAIEADVDVATVAETVTTSGYESDGTYRDYDLFSRSDVRRVLAVRGDALLFGRGERADANVRAMADAGAGELARFHERDEDRAAMTDAAGSRPWLFYGFGGFIRGDLTEHVVGEATGFDYDDDHVYTYYTYLFDDAAAVDVTAIKNEMRTRIRSDESLGPFGPDTMTADIDVDGRVVSVGSRHPREEFVVDDRTTPMPQITWGFDEDAAAGRLTVRHEAGNSVDASVLFLRFDPPAWSQETSETLDDPQQFVAEYDTVEPGDSVTLDTSGLPDATEVRLVYTFENQSASAFDYEVSA
jgi:hypothetical protein